MIPNETYLGWTIKPVFVYHDENGAPNGKLDAQIYPPEGEQGYICPGMTLAQIKDEIQERL